MKLNRRDMLKAAGASVFLPSILAGTRDVWGEDQAGKQSLALHIGLDAVDPRAYGGWSGKLNGCRNDAKSYREISQKMKFSKIKYLSGPAEVAEGSPEATIDNVYRYIIWAARRLKKGDLFLITYAGHGGQMPDTNGDEEDDHRDETWCLYDGQLRDDELYLLWGQFQPGVRILQISDSCHSGTVAREQAASRAIAEDLKLPSTGSKIRAAMPGADNQKELDASQARAVELSNQEPGARGFGVRGTPQDNDGSPLFRDLPEAQIELAYEARRRYYDRVESEIPRGVGRGRSLVQASGLLLAGCQDSQLSMESGGNGLFTTVLKKTWNGGNPQAANYQAFLDDIVSKMPASQTPNFFKFGQPDDSFYYGEKPFEV